MWQSCMLMLPGIRDCSGVRASAIHLRLMPATLLTPDARSAGEMHIPWGPWEGAASSFDTPHDPAAVGKAASRKIGGPERI